mgnify:CR=1 FL=1
MTPRRQFTVTAEDAGRGRVRLVLPFDPDEVWGAKPRHHVGGTVDGQKVRGTIDTGTRDLVLGAMWVRDASVAVGDRVKVSLVPEGPQADELAPDLRLALDADPPARAFFDGLAQFYRKGYVRYIEATKRKPELRAERIAEVVALCHDGKKERA